MRALHLSLLGICLLLFTVFASTDLELPGVNALDDDTTHAALAVDLLRPEYPFSREYTLHLGSQPLPFGISPRAGALKAYLLWPLFALFGPGVILLRGFTIFLGALILVFFYAFLSQQVGKWEAFYAVLFLSLDSAFLFYSKLDIAILEELLWMLVCLWSFAKYARDSRKIDLAVGLLAALLGIYSHLTFVWFLSASLIVSVFMGKDKLIRCFRPPSVYWGIPAMFLTVSLLAYWLRGSQSLGSERPLGFFNLFILFERLSTMGGVLPDVLICRYTKVQSIPGLTSRPLTDLFLVAAILALFYHWKKQEKTTCFLLGVSGMMLLEVSLTPHPAGTFIYHRMMPCYLLLIGLGGIAVAQSIRLLGRFRTRSFFVTALSLGILFLGTASLWGQIALKRGADERIRQTGGKGIWSDAIYHATSFIKEGRWEKTVYFNWDHNSFVFLTGGGVPIENYPWETGEKEKETRLSQTVRSASSKTLLLLGPMSVVHRDDLERAVRTSGKILRLEKIFNDREGEPVYFAYTVHGKRP